MAPERSARKSPNADTKTMTVSPMPAHLPTHLQDVDSAVSDHEQPRQRHAPLEGSHESPEEGDTLAPPAVVGVVLAHPSPFSRKQVDLGGGGGAWEENERTSGSNHAPCLRQNRSAVRRSTTSALPRGAHTGCSVPCENNKITRARQAFAA